jgi:hypothetical protein
MENPINGVVYEKIMGNSWETAYKWMFFAGKIIYKWWIQQTTFEYRRVFKYVF